MIKIKAARQDGSLEFSDAYTNASIVNYRYQLEERIVEAIEQGEFEKVCLAMKELQKGAANLRFISDSFRDQLAGAAVNEHDHILWMVSNQSTKSVGFVTENIMLCRVRQNGFSKFIAVKQ